MVPFSFENIARSASFDPSNAVPVSEAARATHESFESHLQRAAATTIDPSARRPAQEDEPREQSESTSNEPPRNESPPNEPVRQDTAEVQGDDDNPRRSDDAEATTTSETSKGNDQDVEPEAASEAETIIIVNAAGELSVAVQEVTREDSGDSNDVADRAVANKVNVAPRGDEESELDAPPATSAEEPAGVEVIGSGDDAPAGGEVERVSSEHVEPPQSETSTRLVNPPEPDEDVAAGEFPEAAPVAETAIPGDEPLQVNTTPQRHGHRGVISPNQSTSETPDAAPQPVAVHVVETPVDTAGEDRSRQRQHRQETDGPQPTGNSPSADVTATTSGTPSRFAQHLLARTDDPNGRGLSITDADQARFVDRVTRAVQATGERGGTLRLRLSPPELGSLTLEVKVQGGIVSARVEADTSAARSLLLEHLPLLRERLAEHGMRVDQFDVDLSDRHAGETPDGLQQHDRQPEDRPRAKETFHAPEETAPAISGETPSKNGNEQLNIII